MARWLASLKPVSAQVAAQVCYAGLTIITRIALAEGMNHFVFVAYKEAVATIVIAPFAYFLERNKRPAMTCAIFWQSFVLALCGITVYQNLYFTGLVYTSAIFASAITNIVPVFIFVMATAYGMEKLDMNSKYGLAKIMGTIVCVGGAMIMTFYKGSVLLTTRNELTFNTWILGALMLFVGCLFWSGWVTFQTPVVRKYPAQLSLTAIMLFQGTVLSTLVALVFEPKASSWRLKWDIQLLSIIYSGILCSSFALFLQMYCISVRGPVFVAMFGPTSTILVAILEHAILRVKFHLGSLLGTVLIITGLYTVLWGKAKDDNLERDRSDNSHCNIHIRQPLLQDNAAIEHPLDSNTKVEIK
jgi:drug/metabolite transporter (DMT)-like permease